MFSHSFEPPSLLFHMIVSVLMIFWLNFPRDTHPSPTGSEPGKFSMDKTKSCEMLRKSCIEGSSQTGKETLSGNNSLAQSEPLFVAAQEMQSEGKHKVLVVILILPW